MTRAELLEKLTWLAMNGDGDIEAAHGEADDALIAYINDQEIADAYKAVPKWCS